MKQLPGLASQHLMSKGYGYGGEGDWKVSAMTRVMKVMGKRASFMEDYTYDLMNGLSLGAHMLEVCPSIADGKPRLEVHPLGIGGKGDPARLVFDAAPGPAVLATLVDLGGRFRMIVNEIETIKIKESMPRLPVARALWKPLPNMRDAAESWIISGGAHHSVYTTALSAEHFRDWANMMEIEFVLIDRDTKPARLENELRWAGPYWDRA
jgi:L-arabinose isomerase